MAKSTSIKPSHKVIQRYYETIQQYQEQGVKHEGAVETAFQQLLTDTAILSAAKFEANGVGSLFRG